MSWVESASEHFAARHDSIDDRDVAGVLGLLEDTWSDLRTTFPVLPDEPVAVVVHGTRTQLYLAQPHLLAVTRLTAPAARRYVAGWAGTQTLHLLAPRHLRARASGVKGSRQLAELVPAALFCQLVVGLNNPKLPPPLRLRRASAALRWWWLTAGTAQYFANQTRYARPAIARRLREGGRPAFPPTARDAVLLGGSLIDLLAREQGEQAVVDLVRRPPSGAPRDALVEAFGGRPASDTERVWRAHLDRLAGREDDRRATERGA